MRSAPYYRYTYQGQFAEEDKETGWNAFEARMYDSRMGRWLSTDPLRQFYSSYLGVGNNPINAFDVDGRLIIFVNGWLIDTRDVIERRMKGRRSLSDNDDIEYWGYVDDLYKSNYKDNNALYANGSYSPENFASVRYRGGKRAGKKLIKQLRKEKIKLRQGETIKLVGHSMGGAYAAGIAQALIDGGLGDRIGFGDYIASHGNNHGWAHTAGVPGRQFSARKDRVSNHRKIDGILEENYHLARKLKGGLNHYVTDWHTRLQRFFNTGSIHEYVVTVGDLEVDCVGHCPD